MKSAKTILLLFTLFVLSSTKDELYAVDTSFAIVLRTTLDSTFTDAQFMAVGWAENAYKMPAPPAPPGANFYVYIDGYLFKEIRKATTNEIENWDFFFTLSSKQPTRSLFLDKNHIIEYTDSALIIDRNGKIRYDLHNESEIVLDETYGGKFSIVVTPKNSSGAPRLLPSFTSATLFQKTTSTSYTLDLKTVFSNTNNIKSYEVDTFNNSSINYSINNEAILSANISSLHSEIRLRIYAKNEYGQNYADVFLQPDVLTNINEDAIPNKISLSQNYPNPFNPTTTIAFELSEATKVKLTVYNISGQIVATLVNGNILAGKHSAEFNAASLPSGLYLYRLQTNSTVITKKMTLLK